MKLGAQVSLISYLSREAYFDIKNPAVHLG